MLAVVVVALLTAEQSAGPVRLGTPGLTFIDFPEAKGELFVDRLSKQLELNGVRMTGKQEIAAVLGLERQKQLLGCSEDSASCLAELAGALGVDGLLTGTLGRAGTGFLVNLKIVSGGGEAKTLAVVSGRAEDEDRLLDFLDTAAAELSRQVYAALGRAQVNVVAPPPPPERMRPTDLWPLPVAVGVVCLGGGIGMGIVAVVQHRQLIDNTVSLTTDEQLNRHVETAKNFERWAWVAGSVGLALIVAGTAMGIAGRLTAPRRNVQVVAGGAPGFGFVSLSGAWP